jgi:hypothetical protein
MVSLYLLESISSFQYIFYSLNCAENYTVRTMLNSCLNNLEVSLIEELVTSQFISVANTFKVDWLLRSNLFAIGFLDNADSYLVRLLRIYLRFRTKGINWLFV